MVVGSSGSNTTWLVDGFNPFENISQNGSFPQVGVNIKNLWNHHQVEDETLLKQDYPLWTLT